MRILYIGICCALAINLLSACSDDTAQVKADNLPIVEIVATHAFDTPTQITALTFVPNNVAPWLGRIILLDENQHIFSTDIEGRTPLVITPKTYKDIAGMYRENEAGIFFALTNDDKLEAFIQSDNAGNYMPISISGEAIITKQFCKSPELKSDTLKLLSNNKVIDLKFSVQGNVLQYTKTDSEKATKCNALKFPNTEYIGVSDGNLLISGVGETQRKTYLASIQNGLSIMGMENVDYINMTSANYGGGAFKDGVISLIDKNEKRIVFISLDYARRQLTAQ